MVEAAEIRNRWREAAPRWLRYESVVRELTGPVSRAMVNAAGPAPGERWLDVAGGLGDPAEEVARRVRPGGRVVMSDFVHEMASAAARGLNREASVVTAAAEALPFAEAFDGVTCRFGAMFFADPERALCEILAALRPGGRAVFAVWTAPERNPFFGSVADAVRDVVPDTPTPDPDEPNAFRFASTGKLAALFRATRWVDVEEQTVPFVMRAELSVAEFWDFMVGMSADLEALVGKLPADRRRLLRTGVESRAEAYFHDGTSRFPAEARLVLARRPDKATT